MGYTVYNSHHMMLKSGANDFVIGPIKVNGPSSVNYDIDLGPWLLSDWYHADVFGLEWIGETTHLAAIPESTVLNERGIFECNKANDTRCLGTGGPLETVVKRNKKYKIGIVNTSTLLTYTFWIDGHDLTIIATDFVPIKPYVTQAINVGIGMRSHA